MTLPMATYFHRATLLALPTNLVLVPVIAVLLALTILTFFTSLISLAIARIPAACTAVLIHLIRAVVAHIGHLSVADMRVPGSFVAIYFARVCGDCPGVWRAATALPLVAGGRMRRVDCRASCSALAYGSTATSWGA